MGISQERRYGHDAVCIPHRTKKLRNKIFCGNIPILKTVQMTFIENLIQ